MSWGLRLDRGRGKDADMQIIEYAGLTDKQSALVSALLDGLSISDAGARAGYSSAPAAYHASNTPSVQVALRTAMLRQMAKDAPMAWKLIVDTARDETVDRKLRTQCANSILDRTGFVPPKAAEASAERALEDMTRDELVAFISQAHARRAAMATDVSTPDNAAADQQLADMLE